MRRGAWVLLDELNLASQTVLEGLNAVLDHRAEVRAVAERAPDSWPGPCGPPRDTLSLVRSHMHSHRCSFTPQHHCCTALQVFIPELNRTFRCPPTFRVFGAQNPLQEGGGRKGLPRSFLNRFTRVHVELLRRRDLLFIAAALHPRLPAPTLRRMVAALQGLHHGTNVRCVSRGGERDARQRCS